MRTFLREARAESLLVLLIVETQVYNEQSNIVSAAKRDCLFCQMLRDLRQSEASCSKAANVQVNFFFGNFFENSVAAEYQNLIIGFDVHRAYLRY